MLKKVLRKLEAKLYHSGFYTQESRYLAARVILAMDLCLAISLPVAFFDLHLLWFSIGLTLAAHNFKAMSAFTHAAVSQNFSGALAMRQFFNFFLRFLITAVVLFVCLVVFQAPAWPLLLGLSSVVAWLAFWGISHYKHQNLTTKNLRAS